MTTPASRSTLVRPDGEPRRTDRGRWSRMVSDSFLITSQHLHQFIRPRSARRPTNAAESDVNRPRTPGTDAEPTKGTHHVQL